MIIEISKPVNIIVEKEKAELPQNLEKQIKLFWKDVIKQNPNFWDGDAICVQNFEEFQDKIVLTCRKTNYSHYLYDERIGIKDKKYWGSCLWGGILLRTKDNYYVLGEMAEDTSTPLCIETPGGGVDKADIEQQRVNIIKTIQRELKEELNLELDNMKQITKYRIKYLEIPEEKRHAYGVLAVGDLEMTKLQMEEHYNTYLKYLQNNKSEIEFKSVQFFSFENAYEVLKNMKNPKRNYIFEVLKKER